MALTPVFEPLVALVAQPGAVLDDLELVAAGRQYNINSIALLGPGHILTRPVIEGAVEGNNLGITTVAALAVGVQVTPSFNGFCITIVTSGAFKGL